MDKELIEKAGKAAISALKLDCRVEEVKHNASKNLWCIQFTDNYGQFCDEFRDRSGEENSTQVIREKIKRHFLKQRRPKRVIKGRNAVATRRQPETPDLLSTIAKAGQQALMQATRITTEVVNRAVNLNRAVMDTEADWVQSISPTAAEMLRPQSSGSSSSPVRPSRTDESQSAAEAPLETEMPSARRAGADRRAATTTTEKGAGRASKKGAGRSGSAKKSAKKSGAKKSVAKSASAGKRAAGSKKSGKKRKSKVKLFY